MDQFSKHTLLFSNTVRRHGIGYRLHAGDTKVCILFDTSHTNSATEAKFNLTPEFGGVRIGSE